MSICKKLSLQPSPTLSQGDQYLEVFKSLAVMYDLQELPSLLIQPVASTSSFPCTPTHAQTSSLVTHFVTRAKTSLTLSYPPQVVYDLSGFKGIDQ